MTSARCSRTSSGAIAASRSLPKTVTQKAYVDAIRRRTVTFGIGPAGTGKTYLAMALAVAALQERQVARIILTRPAVEAGERLGFLPGDMLAKVDPYLRPLFDALYDMLDPERANTYMERGTIEVAPLAFMRGRTLNDSFIILDEAQNTSPEQMQMFLTRLGFGSKVVVHGRRDPGRPAARPAVRADPGAGDPRRDRRDRVRPLRPSRRRPAQARAADRRGLPRARGGDGHRTEQITLMLTVEVDNRSGARSTRAPRSSSPAGCCAPRGSTTASSGSRSSAPDEIRELKREHLGIDEATDVLSFPIDGRDALPGGLPRALGDVVLCPQVVGDAWRAPLTHGLLHLLGYDHGEEMERREAELRT